MTQNVEKMSPNFNTDEINFVAVSGFLSPILFPMSGPHVCWTAYVYKYKR